MHQVEHILAVNNTLGEGPVWSREEQALYWVDIEQNTFYRFEPSLGKHEVFDVGISIGALALRVAGGLVMATKKGFAFWDPQRGLHVLADPEADTPHTRFNDGAVDCRGRFWAGTMCGRAEICRDPEGNLYRLDPDGSISTMETDIFIANGIGWSPDNTIMYFTDSPRHVIYAYDFDPATGMIANRRSFISTPDETGDPDGLTVDSEGCIWSARWGGWKVTRYDPTGKVEREIFLPVQYPTSCAFGGADLDELYITSAWTALSQGQRKNQPLAGDLFRLKTGIKGQERPKFAG
ncbi:MAG: CBU_1789 family Dot/Icm type IV secretion system effector [Ktedonobacteraceae bacterium]